VRLGGALTPYDTRGCVGRRGRPSGDLASWQMRWSVRC